MVTKLLSLRSGVSPGEENRPDDLANVHTSLSDNGFQPIGRPFQPAEVPVAETGFFQEDADLTADGVIKPGDPTEQIMNKRAAENAERDARTLNGFLTDPEIDGPVGAVLFGPGMTVAGNKRRDVLRAREAVAAAGVRLPDEDMPTHGMDSISLESALRDFQAGEPDLETDGIMTPGGLS